MSRPFRRSLSSRRSYANLLAISFGVGFTALSGFAFGQICAELIGVSVSTMVGSPVGVRMGVPAFADIFNHLLAQSVIPGTTFINWGDGTGSVATVSGPLFNPDCMPPTPPEACEYYSVFSAAPHRYSAAMTGIHVTVTAEVHRITGANVSFSCSSPAFDVLDIPPPGGDVLSNPRLQLRNATVNFAVTGVVATFSDSNRSAVVSDFTALIDWGDGTQSPGVVSGAGGRLSVSAAGDHAYGQTGGVTVSVSLSAPGIATSTANGTVHVRNQRRRQ